MFGEWTPRQQSFFDQMWPLAMSASQRTGVPAQTIFAQSALETGWGRSAPQNNYFGIKGPGGTQRTWEVINGQRVNVNASFRGYSSMAESVDGYVDFITNPNSRRWTGARNADTPEAAARAIAAGGYATDPQYANKLIDIIRGIPNPFAFGASRTPNQSAEADDPLSRFRQWGKQFEINPGEIAKDWTGDVLASLSDPAKRVGFVVIGILLVGISIFVILNGPKAVAGAAQAYITRGRSVVKNAAMEAVA